MSIFGGNTGVTYEQLQQRRKMAERLREQNSRVPRNVGEGIHAIARGLVVSGVDKQNAQRSREMRDQYGKIWESLAGATGGAYAPFDGGGQSFGGTLSRPDMPAGNLDMGRPDMSRYRDAVASIESAGSGDYQAIGPTHRKMGRALGRYQVMEANLPQWSREALRREVSADEFLASPEIQDAIFDHKFGGYVENFGEEGAAQAWFAGPGGVGKMGRKDSLGTSVADYTRKFSRALGGERPQGVRTAQAGGIDPSIAQLAQLLSAPDEFMPPGQKAVVQALLQRKLAQSDPSNQLDLEYKREQLNQMRNPQPDLTSGQREYEMARQQGYQGTFMDYKRELAEAQRSSTNVNVSTGAPGIGKLSTDYGYVLDPQTGEPVIDPQTGLPKAAPVPGSPAARDIEAGRDKEIGRDAQTRRAGSTVIQDLQRGLELLPELGILAQNEGVVGGILRTQSAKIPGTVANRITQFTESALSNVGLDTLQTMRENSPTGGALGQVPIQQQKRLEQVLGSLNINQLPSVLEANIKRVINIYTDIIHGSPEERAEAVRRGMMTPEENAQIESYYYDLPFDERGRPVGQDGRGVADPAEVAPAGGQMSFEEFAADPSAQAAAQKYGVTLEEMWAIKNGGQ